ncbi:MAG: ScyD/ScyE family protein [Propionibacteriales bacterium]|nr:ScyD/ScyE family protein [Propionibacteriales bacterium]
MSERLATLPTVSRGSACHARKVSSFPGCARRSRAAGHRRRADVHRVGRGRRTVGSGRRRAGQPAPAQLRPPRRALRHRSRHRWRRLHTRPDGSAGLLRHHGGGDPAEARPAATGADRAPLAGHLRRHRDPRSLRHRLQRHGQPVRTADRPGRRPSRSCRAARGGRQPCLAVHGQGQGRWRSLGEARRHRGLRACGEPRRRSPRQQPGRADPRGGDYVVADAGGNALLEVEDDDDIETLAVFPDQTSGGATFQAVPTSVAKGPDGAYYVSQLTGFPFIPGAANIWRVEEGEAPEIYAEGLTHVTDLAFNDGDLYAVQISDTGLQTGLDGSVVKVNPDGGHETVIDGLFAPYGIAFRKDHAYVTTCAVCTDTGQVVKANLDD